MTSDTENKSKLKTFFDKEYRSLRAYAHSRISDTADRNAEDIVQDVALKLFSRTHDASPINNVAGFVYSAIRNQIIDLMRTKKGKYPFENSVEAQLKVLAQQLHPGAEELYSTELKYKLKKAIGNLKPHYREVIVAIDFEGYSYKELASETNIPKGTLMSRRHRALAILFKELKNKK